MAFGPVAAAERRARNSVNPSVDDAAVVLGILCVRRTRIMQHGVNVRGCGQGAKAVRYVIVIIAIAFFIIWDGLYNQGIYLDQFIRMLVDLMHAVGL